MPSYIRECVAGLSVRSKQSSKELGEIARMTETCLFSDRLGCDSLSVSAVLVQTLWPVQMSTLKCWSGFSTAEIPFCILSSKQERGREGGLSAARQEWVDMYWVHLGAPASMMHHPVARTGLHSPLHLHQASLSPSPPPPPLAYNSGVPFQKKFFQLNLPFPTFTRRQYHFQREMLVDALPQLCLLY